VARYLAEEAGVGAPAFEVETGAGLLRCEVLRDAAGAIDAIAVEMGPPELDAARIPMAAQGRFVRSPLEVDGETLRATAVSMGNPHLVLFDVDRRRAAELGPRIERHPLFPRRTNVELAEVDGGGLDVMVWERGCGFTAACGTGACAAAVAAVLEGRLPAGTEIPVRLAGGLLYVEVRADLGGVRMRGPAVRVFQGELALPEAP
jgi:diaminopimelate epimerase